MSSDRAERNRRSAEWAAYGDALGFMTELADTDRVQRRTGTPLVQDTTRWRRTIGSYNGVSVSLPAGTYSDDTQLRLSTGRAIRADGTFDVAAFAKVELPAWANYALGAGVGTKEAAANLARTSATWYSNLFESKRAAYIRSGGNGAAMRVQPHVWAARDLSDADAVLLDVVRNAVCTHGHPRGILGACFHALTLLFAIREGRPATMDEARVLVERLKALPHIIQKGDLRLLWLGAWEQANDVPFEEAVNSATKEMIKDIGELARLTKEKPSSMYEKAVRAIGAVEPTYRGSGTKTALLATLASSLTEPSDPKAVLIAVANFLGSDTDSIATMAGAILGVCTEHECEGALQDRDYIRSEAKRMAAIAEGSPTQSFRYPDLRSWKPVRAAVDAVGVVDGHLWLNGLGELEPVERKPVATVGADTLGWYRLAFGQTILARVRSHPNALLSEPVPAIRQSERSDNRTAVSPPVRLRDLFAHNDPPPFSDENELEAFSEERPLSEQLRQVIASGFSPEMIGRALLRQVDRGGSDFVERGIALAANILTAYEARSKRRGR